MPDTTPTGRLRTMAGLRPIACLIYALIILELKCRMQFAGVRESLQSDLNYKICAALRKADLEMPISERAIIEEPYDIVKSTI